MPDALTERVVLPMKPFTSVEKIRGYTTQIDSIDLAAHHNLLHVFVSS
jgi:hypothetical protein